jgi:hypothetical protein
MLAELPKMPLANWMATNSHGKNGIGATSGANEKHVLNVEVTRVPHTMTKRARKRDPTVTAMIDAKPTPAGYAA